MNSLLPPNATPFERALEAAMARLSAVPLPLRSLRRADVCPIEVLPWLAWELGVDAWKPYWPEQIKRARVQQAMAIHRRKGTVAAVKAVVAAYGANISIREWWQTTPRGKPHTFELVMNVSARDGKAPSAAFVDDIIADVSRAKRLSAHFTFRQGIAASATVAVIAAIRPVIYARLELRSV